MAITSNKIATVLQLRVKTGTDENGDDVLENQTYRRVKLDTTDDNMYGVAQTIGSLESTPVISVVKVESYDIINQ